MNNDTIMYSSKDVAKRLSVQPVTLRKYAQLLEDKGVSFTKDEKGWRTYSEENIRFLEYLYSMKKMGKSLEEAADHIATLYRMNLAIAQPAIPLQEENLVIQFIQTQHEFNQKLMEQLNKMEQRQIEQQQLEHDRIFIQNIRKSQKKLATNQQKKWWRIFNKK